ncbi:MAG: IS1 family transposase [Sulfurovum sp.]
MDIIIVVHSDISVKDVEQSIHGNTKKKVNRPKHRLKREILDCYGEGMGMNAICRVFKVSLNTLKQWIKLEGKEFNQPDISKEKFVSCDEMWTFVQKKKTKAWIWLCYSKMTKKILAVHIGDRSAVSAGKLIEQVPNMKIYCTDNWNAYAKVIVNPQTHEIGKRNTQDIERFNLTMRMRLARLQRQTIKFSKSLEMLKYSVNFLLNRYNYQLL